VEPFCTTHHCEYGRIFLCKGKALEDYIRERKEKDGVAFSTVTYLGDGKNDYCAMAELKKGDLVTHFFKPGILDGQKFEISRCRWFLADD
jgi:pyridoxal phosphate phosphatase PHOSPHO2